MDWEASKKWLKSALIAAVGGGIAAALAAAFDPEKYNIAHDIGSGKLWEFFFEGAGVTFGALLIKSPLGQQAMSAYKDSQAKMEQNKADVQAVKDALKPPPAKP